MAVEIRRTLTHVQDTFIEGGFTLEAPTRLVAALAVGQLQQLAAATVAPTVSTAGVVPRHLLFHELR